MTDTFKIFVGFERTNGRSKIGIDASSIEAIAQLSDKSTAIHLSSGSMHVVEGSFAETLAQIDLAFKKAEEFTNNPFPTQGVPRV
jgi:uncharacterized protein YlzI (FlbEa/FlbD family)